MNPEQFEKMQEIIEATIKTTVNGKIDRIDNKIDTYIQKDNEWKDGVTPSIEIIKKMQGFWSVSGTIFKTVILVAGIPTALAALWNFIFKNH